MRILHYIESVRLSIGGTVRAALDMCAGLASLGHEVVLLTLDDTDVPEEWRGDRGAVRVVSLGQGESILGRLSARQLIVAEREIQGAEMVHIHAVWDLPNAQVASVCRRLGRAYVVSAHGMLDDWAMAQKRLKKLVYLRCAGGNRFLRGAAAMHFASASEAEQSPKWVPGVPSRSVPLLFDSAEYAELPGPLPALEKYGISTDGPPIIGFLSRLTSGKRADLVIRAAGALRKRGCDSRLVIAGSGDASEESTLRQMVDAEGLRDATTWTGAVYGDLKVSLYQAMSVFVLPSDHENFCFAIVEAMAAGTPVATVRTVGIWKDVVESGGGVVCDPDPECVADAIEPWLTTEPSRVAAGKAARRWAMETLNMRRLASEYIEMYHDAQRRTSRKR
jgi:glycosyltransferase involved in cell wall biosynthesis